MAKKARRKKLTNRAKQFGYQVTKDEQMMGGSYIIEIHKRYENGMWEADIKGVKTIMPIMGDCIQTLLEKVGKRIEKDISLRVLDNSD